MEASISLKKVGKTIGDRTVLAGLTFGIEKGTIVAIIGDNESGKSTLLKILSGLDNPEFGSVFIHGLDAKNRREETRMMLGFVPHEIDLDPWLTLEENIRFSGLLFGADNDKITHQISVYSRALNLTDFLHNPASKVSPGIQKKTMLVRALAHDPTVLILDEPTTFMDTRGKRETWNLLREFRKKKTVLYVSQSLEEVEAAHDRIIMLENGRVLLDGSLEKLLESTFEYHQFGIEFEQLTDQLYILLSTESKVINPSRTENVFQFYGRSRSVFFDIIRLAAENVMTDVTIKKLGLRDLLDFQFTRDEIE
ncbi:MAG: ABC transporter ATP-binding protein [Candidatus Marinimicrobia bacterium]|jgi:ABC-2 type transport system ATP-binding protein|nr:ABC transporter ATP-binding protein [Candidatus Neomarinimicrobiota bacterium]MBT3618332.1 ABC transporter ATP-binding protein [Candidatus Neomarinimicrobiota bacterium]MBT3829127.1 ABC transporter ATP-binding protein [Candidatus Neomarinimicrobiota bacterium]MBT3998095.1 ABC transporter ATP-binding protein [Candidatus Neomarinimicrobiota bacterium]MBT4281436.1 ABC transporter ATP-binding protein [Candidatus Neomarinimicrobiota bacterium]